MGYERSQPGCRARQKKDNFIGARERILDGFFDIVSAQGLIKRLGVAVA
jgi:hypothetical protein